MGALTNLLRWIRTKFMEFVWLPSKQLWSGNKHRIIPLAMISVTAAIVTEIIARYVVEVHLV